jgi:hypothetical protein
VYATGLMNGLEITVVYTGSGARRLAHHFGVAGGAASTPAPLEQHRERRRLKPKGSKINEGKTKRSNAEQGTGTDWGKVAPHECGPHRQRDHRRRILEERISKELEGVLGG